MKDIKIEFAPLQGVTDSIYRKIFSEKFKGINSFFTPFENADSKQVKSNYLIRRFSPPKLSNISIIPQLISNTPDNFLEKCKLLHEHGFNEINLNMGCPYPTVLKKGRGAGMLENLSTLEKFLSRISSDLPVPLSVKIRSGIRYHEDILRTIEILNKFTLKEVIIHPRTAEQKYNGTANYNIFIEAAKYSKNPVAYNGDIATKNDFTYLYNIFKKSEISCSYMIGRGLLKNPFLAEEILFDDIDENMKLLRMEDFIRTISEAYSDFLSGDSHFLSKIKEFWSYTAPFYSNGNKHLKSVRKCVTKKKYFALLDEFLTETPLISDQLDNIIIKR